MIGSSQDGFRIHFSEAFHHRILMPALGLCLLGAFLLIIYWPGFQGQWFLDDFGNIHENPNIQADTLTWNALSPAIYGRDPGRQKIDRPVAYLTLAINYALGGTDPIGYHIVNFLIHILTAMAIYLLARATLTLPSMADRYSGQAHAVALLGSLLWAIHPIQVTAVTYIVQRMAAMAALFTVLAMICFVKGSTPSRSRAKGFWWLLCVLCGLLALGSKQNAVMLPVSLGIYGWVFFGGGKSPGRIRWLWPATGLIIVGLIAAMHVGWGGAAFIDGYRDRPFTLWQRLLTEPRVIWRYVWMLVYPVSSRFTLLHDITISTGVWNPWTTLPAIISIACAAGIALLRRRRNPLLSFGILFFLVNHAVEGTLLPLELVFEHRNYLPSTFLFLAAGAGILEVFNYFAYTRVVRTLTAACVVLVLISSGHTSLMRNERFTSRAALWAHNIQIYPNLHRPHHNLAKALFEIGRETEALSELQAALQASSEAHIAQKLLSHYNLGVYYRFRGDYDRAAHHLDTVLRFSSTDDRTLIQRARVYTAVGDLDQAARLLARVQPPAAKGYDHHLAMGILSLARGDTTTAMQHAIAAFSLQPQHPEVVFLLGETAAASRRWQPARGLMNRCIELEPRHTGARLAMIEIFDMLGNQAQRDAMVRAVIAASIQAEDANRWRQLERQLWYNPKERIEKIRRIMLDCKRLLK